jgi:hypothetical protein
MNYEEKYLKYKNKYLNLKNDNLQQIGGNPGMFIPAFSSITFPKVNSNSSISHNHHVILSSIIVFVLYMKILLIEYKNGESGEYVEDVKKKMRFLVDLYVDSTTHLNLRITSGMYYSEDASNAELFANTLFEYISKTQLYKESPYVTKKVIKQILMLDGKKISPNEYINRYVDSFMITMNAYLNGYNGYENNININSAKTTIISSSSNAFDALYVTYEYRIDKYPTYPIIDSNDISDKNLETLADFIYTIIKVSSKYIENDFTNKDAIKNILLLKPVVLTKDKPLTPEDKETYSKNIAKRIYNLLVNYKNGQSVVKKNIKPWKDELLKNYNNLVIVSKDVLPIPESNITNIDQVLLKLIRNAKTYDLIQSQKVDSKINDSYIKLINHALFLATTINRIISTYNFTLSATESFITISAILYLLLERLPHKQ